MQETNNKNEVAPIESPPPQMSVFAKIIGIFLEPRKTFNALEKKPDFIIPLVLVVIVAFILTYISSPILQQSTLEMSRERMMDQGMTETQIQLALEQQQKYGKIGGLIAVPLTSLLSPLIIAAVLLFAGNILLGGNAKYKQLFSLYCYTSLIDIITYAVRTILILIKQDIRVYTSLAALLPPDYYKLFWFKFANIFDIFVIWKIIVVSIGMSVLYRISTRKPLITVSLIYLIFALVSISFL